MKMLSLQTAVAEIVGATRRRKEAEPWGKFFFMVGAGISHPPIPLAWGIEQLCRVEIAEGDLEKPLETGSDLERYQSCFERAFAQPADRQGFLHKHINGEKISAANFRLAHLLGEKGLTNLVFTTNFDDMLSKALRLLGNDVIVCDHPKTTSRVDLHRSEPQIVHVHGTHWFYDCCNLKDELAAQAGSEMGQLLDLVLWDRSPLVIGYSGWDGDVFMAALKRRLDREKRLPFNIYWFCFQRSEKDRLPKWLTDHENTRLVVPPEAPIEGACDSISSPGFERPLAVAFGGSGSLTSKPTLKASWVFQEFIRKLDVPAPRLVDEPLEFFADFLERNLPDDNDEGIGPFLMRNVFERIQEGARLERKARETRTPQELALGLLGDAVRRFLYREAAEIAERLDLALLTSSQRDSLERALHELYVSIPDSESASGLMACEVRARLAELSPEDEWLDSSWPLRVAEAMNGKGYYLSLLDRHEEAIAAFERVIERFGTLDDSRLRERVASALINKALVLGSIGKFQSQIDTLDELDERFGEGTEPALKKAAGRALIIKAGVLGKTSRPEDVRVVCDELIDRFGGTVECDILANALVNEAFMIDERAWCEQEEMSRWNLYQGAITMYQAALRLTPENSIAWKNLAADLLRLGREKDDSSVTDEALVASLRAAAVGGGRYNLACALALTGKSDDALDELEYCLERGEISRDEVALDPDWESFHSNPRFKAFLDTDGSA